MQKGKPYEERAKNYLTAKGYRIVSTNYRSKWGEIDIIALKGNTLFVIEVKGGKNIKRLPERVSCSKIGKILKTFKVFLYENPGYENFDIHLKAIFVDNRGTIEEVLISPDQCFENF